MNLELKEITSSVQPDQRFEFEAQYYADKVEPFQLHLAL